MIVLGNFFFRYRNLLFLLLYLMLFIPSPAISGNRFPIGEEFLILTGLLVSISGQLIRGATIGLSYIIRGGKDGKVYAEGLVTDGLFSHCRNPLYLGNILMLLGLSLIANSLLYLFVVMPIFVFIYQSIVLAEESFLRRKFGGEFVAYCSRVNRWFPRLRNIGKTYRSMRFNWRRWLVKEYNTLYIWLTGILLVLSVRYRPVRLPGYSAFFVPAFIFLLITMGYFFIRWKKKKGNWKNIS